MNAKRMSVLLLLSLPCLWAATPAAAQSLEISARLITERLQVELHLAPAEVEVMLPLVTVHLEQGGREQSVRELVMVSLDSGCRGRCLGTALSSMNRAHSAGLSHTDARRAVTEELRGAASEGGDMEEHFRVRMDRRVGKKEHPGRHEGGRENGESGRGNGRGH
ncbi:MAG: hypothetical protein OEW11_07935 [Nitrospirota bacterium]|nr:hypothetical protein [Nitrospirota bacterium]